MVGGNPATMPPLIQEEVEMWYRQVAGDPLHWIIALEERCIGTARLHNLDRQNRRARYAIGIFDPACWGQGYGTEATRLVLRYAFEELKLHRVDLRVLEFNHRAIACYEKCGFVREGIEREGSRIGFDSKRLCVTLGKPPARSASAASTRSFARMRAGTAFVAGDFAARCKASRVSRL